MRGLWRSINTILVLFGLSGTAFGQQGLANGALGTSGASGTSGALGSGAPSGYLALAQQDGETGGGEPQLPDESEGDDSEATNRELEARIVYERGVKAYGARKYQEAIELFKHANKLKPNAAFSFNIGIAYQDLGDTPNALRYYRDYLRQLPGAPDRADVVARVRQLEAVLQSQGIQQVTILTQPEAAALTLDGKAVGISPWTGELGSGHHELIVNLSGYNVERRYFDLPAERSIDVNVTLQEADPGQPVQTNTLGVDPNAEQGLPRDVPWIKDVRAVTWGIFAIGVASLGVSGVYGYSAGNSLRAAREADDDSEVKAKLLDSREDRRRWAHGFLLLGLGLSGSTLALVVSDVSKAREFRRELALRRMQAGCFVDGCSFSLSGTF